MHHVPKTFYLFPSKEASFYILKHFICFRFILVSRQVHAHGAGQSLTLYKYRRFSVDKFFGSWQVSDQYISITFIRSFQILGHAFYSIELIGFPLISNQLRSKAIVGNGHLAVMASIEPVSYGNWLGFTGGKEQKQGHGSGHI